MGHDTIRLTGLKLSGHHGVFDWEKQQAQPFEVDADLDLDLSTAGSTDALADTVSYAEIADLIDTIVSGESFNLIEALGETLARAILVKDHRIRAVTVTVHKPQAPLDQSFADVAVTIRRTREQVSHPGSYSPQQAARVEGPRPELRGYYEGELVEDSEPSVSSASVAEDIGVTVTTGTVQLGHYQRRSLAPHPDSRTQAAGSTPSAPGSAHYRDPDLKAAFPVRCVLALGSNLGDSSAMLTSAIRELQDAEGVEVIKLSPVARTKPVGGVEHQRDYLNQVIEIETQLSPHDLLDLAQQVEADHNRVREERWGPRTLDVDIVTYAGAAIDSPRLQVPHPSAAERAFVLLPWSWMDPVALLNGRPVRELALQAADAGDVRRVDDQEAPGAHSPQEPGA